jgi:hypothetical protein
MGVLDDSGVIWAYQDRDISNSCTQHGGMNDGFLTTVIQELQAEGPGLVAADNVLRWQVAPG